MATRPSDRPPARLDGYIILLHVSGDTRSRGVDKRAGGELNVFFSVAIRPPVPRSQVAAIEPQVLCDSSLGLFFFGLSPRFLLCLINGVSANMRHDSNLMKMIWRN